MIVRVGLAVDAVKTTSVAIGAMDTPLRARKGVMSNLHEHVLLGDVRPIGDRRLDHRHLVGTQ